VALAAAQRIPAPAERAAALIEMAVACETPAPARAEALFRRALRAAEALPAGQGRQSAILDAATGLAAYDLKAARDAVLKAAAAGPVPATSMMMLGARAAKREPAAARKLIERAAPPPAAPPGFIGGIPGPSSFIGGNPAGPSSFIGSREIVLAEVTTEPDLRRALVLAQQALGPVLQAQALLAVARRLKQRGEAPAAGARIREQQTTKDTGTQRT